MLVDRDGGTASTSTDSCRELNLQKRYRSHCSAVTCLTGAQGELSLQRSDSGDGSMNTTPGSSVLAINCMDYLPLLADAIWGLTMLKSDFDQTRSTALCRSLFKQHIKRRLVFPCATLVVSFIHVVVGVTGCRYWQMHPYRCVDFYQLSCTLALLR